MSENTLQSRIGFYFLSFTWGAIMSIIGLLVIAALAPFKKVHVYHGRLYAAIGKGWGGFNLGCFFICAEDCQTDYTMKHEAGHGIQNIIWGPLMPFVITIPSAIRYWYRTIRNKLGKPNTTEYNDVWFEDQASRWGEEFVMTDQL